MEIKQMYLTAGHPNRPATKLSKVTGVVVHWTANEASGANAVANRNYFNRSWKGTQDNALESDGSGFRYASAHINVDDTTRIDCLPWKKGEAEMGYHVGGTYVSGILAKLETTYPNNCTIGLEICVNADGNFAKAYANGVQVIAEMLKEHGLGIDALIRHYDVTGKLCPGFFTQDTYAQKYLGTTALAAYAKFRTDVQATLSGTTAPAYYKVYQAGALYKYQFTTEAGAEDAAKALFKESAGKDATIYVTDPNGVTIYTPAMHPEDFPGLTIAPAVIKERVSETDVRFLKLAKGTFTLKLVWGNGKTVTQLVKESGAAYGFNFPFFTDYKGGYLPIADTKIGTQIINTGYDTPGGAQQTKWHSLMYKNGQVDIGMFNINTDVGADGFIVSTTPMLIEGGNPCWDWYRVQEGTASDIGKDSSGYVRCQRTFVGLDKDSNLLIAATDGRTSASRGFNLEDMSNYMVSKGAVNALNGDGGSSTVLADQSGSLGQNKGSSERAVNHAILVFFNKPTSTPTPPPATTTPTTPTQPTTPQYWRVFVDGAQQGAYGNEGNATTIAKTLYLQTKSANILVKDPALNVIYTPSKHPEDFPELIVNPLDEATQKAVYSLLKKKFG